ncbi:unnamed protein product [Pleuronectes platessa]|uniref:Uncharacterized protein n=1 Tax=Pleuronectes platessa TaxID=8262 RepID=A0A9N7ZEA1_PLEPL|nr:unnamed protein product [Pleuronectes platessa]
MERRLWVFLVPLQYNNLSGQDRVLWGGGPVVGAVIEETHLRTTVSRREETEENTMMCFTVAVSPEVVEFNRKEKKRRRAGGRLMVVALDGFLIDEADVQTHVPKKAL